MEKIVELKERYLDSDYHSSDFDQEALNENNTNSTLENSNQNPNPTLTTSNKPQKQNQNPNSPLSNLQQKLLQEKNDQEKLQKAIHKMQKLDAKLKDILYEEKVVKEKSLKQSRQTFSELMNLQFPSVDSKQNVEKYLALLPAVGEASYFGRDSVSSWTSTTNGENKNTQLLRNLNSTPSSNSPSKKKPDNIDPKLFSNIFFQTQVPNSENGSRAGQHTSSHDADHQDSQDADTLSQVSTIKNDHQDHQDHNSTETLRQKSTKNLSDHQLFESFESDEESETTDIDGLSTTSKNANASQSSNLAYNDTFIKRNIEIAKNNNPNNYGVFMTEEESKQLEKLMESGSESDDDDEEEAALEEATQSPSRPTSSSSSLSKHKVLPSISNFKNNFNKNLAGHLAIEKFLPKEEKSRLQEIDRQLERLGSEVGSVYGGDTGSNCSLGMIGFETGSITGTIKQDISEIKSNQSKMNYVNIKLNSLRSQPTSTDILPSNSVRDLAQKLLNQESLEQSRINSVNDDYHDEDASSSCTQENLAIEPIKLSLENKNALPNDILKDLLEQAKNELNLDDNLKKIEDFGSISGSRVGTAESRKSINGSEVA